jgi:hypothetical protein
MEKKIKEIKGIGGTDIATINGNRTYLTCITNNGERFSIGFKMLFKLFDNYEFVVEKHGEHFRTIDFRIPELEELSPQKLIEKLS